MTERRRPIARITIEGFRSIRQLDHFRLENISVLIGANGAGKSNFVSFFSLLRELVEGRLELAINKAGGADSQLYLGPKITDKIVAELEFGLNRYRFVLEPTIDNRLIFSEESIFFTGSPNLYPVDRQLGVGHQESKLKQESEDGPRRAIAKHIYDAIASWIVYHVHDTSETAPMRRYSSVLDSERLRPDAGNLASYLFRLKSESKFSYEMIREAVRLVAPFFDDFRLRPRKSKTDEILQLEWTQKGSDYPFHPGHLSDGTIRFIALATALLQPSPPTTILIDEPELGLHPYALDVLASLMRQASHETQLIVSTQSPSLLNGFEPDQIVVIERMDEQSTMRRLNKEDLREWVATEYTLGELWQKDVYGGSPMHE